MDKQTTQEDFFAPANLFKIMLGEDGQGGAIGKLNENLAKTNSKVDHLVKVTIPCFERKLKEYNGLHEDVVKIKTDLAAQVEICEKVQNAKVVAEDLVISTAEAYKKGVAEAEEKGANQTKETIKYTVWLVIKVLTALALATGIVGWIVGLWR